MMVLQCRSCFQELRIPRGGDGDWPPCPHCGEGEYTLVWSEEPAKELMPPDPVGLSGYDRWKTGGAPPKR